MAAKTSTVNALPDTHKDVREVYYRADASSPFAGCIFVDVSIPDDAGGRTTQTLRLEDAPGVPNAAVGVSLANLTTVRGVLTAVYNKALAQGGFV